MKGESITQYGTYGLTSTLIVYSRRYNRRNCTADPATQQAKLIPRHNTKERNKHPVNPTVFQHSSLSSTCSLSFQFYLLFS